MTDAYSVCASLRHGRPFVQRCHGTLSLHFDSVGIQSEMLCEAPNELLVPYTQTMMGFLLFKPQPRQIVAIGLGGGSIPKYCYAKLPQASVVVAEINPEVVALRDLFCIPEDDERFRVLCEDGAVLVRTLQNCVDVLLVDGFDLNGQAAQLCTQQFYDDCYRSLAPGGLAVINLTIEDPYLGRSVARIGSAFDDTVVVDSEDCANKVVFASKSPGLSLSYEHLCTRLVALESHHSVGLRNTLQRIRYEQYRSRTAVD